MNQQEMSKKMNGITNPEHRHDILILTEVYNGNPNGDPDNEGRPRVDEETGHGYITDTCFKRKIRDRIDRVHNDGTNGCGMYVQNDAPLEEKRANIYKECGIKIKRKTKKGKDGEEVEGGYEAKGNPEDVAKAVVALCEKFYDVRMFGAVASLGIPCGRVTGAAQFTVARSVDPITVLDLAMTRKAVNSQKELDEGKETEMGATRTIIPHALYKGYAFITPHYAAKNGVTMKDLELFFEAVQGMYTMDRAAMRGYMSVRGVYVFTHENPLGNAPEHELFKRIKVQKNDDEYEVVVDEENMPEGVTLTRLVG